MAYEEYQKFEQKIFSGYLSADPETRYTESGSVIGTFSIPQSENKEAQTYWLNCVAFGKRAEYIGENFKKKDRITVVGEFKTETYNEKEYTKFYVNGILN